MWQNGGFHDDWVSWERRDGTPERDPAPPILDSAEVLKACVFAPREPSACLAAADLIEPFPPRRRLIAEEPCSIRRGLNRIHWKSNLTRFGAVQEGFAPWLRSPKGADICCARSAGSARKPRFAIGTVRSRGRSMPCDWATRSLPGAARKPRPGSPPAAKRGESMRERDLQAVGWDEVPRIMT